MVKTQRTNSRRRDRAGTSKRAACVTAICYSVGQQTFPLHKQDHLHSLLWGTEQELKPLVNSTLYCSESDQRCLSEWLVQDGVTRVGSQRRGKMFVTVIKYEFLCWKLPQIALHQAWSQRQPLPFLSGQAVHVDKETSVPWGKRNAK